MAYSTITNPKEHFESKLYAGSSSNVTVSGLEFQPDWIWLKNRSNTDNHAAVDAVRGSGSYGFKNLYPNLTDAEYTPASGNASVVSIASSSFVVGQNSNTNGNGENFVSWNWKANGAGSANSDGSISSTVSANTTAGFSIVKWTSNGSDSDGIGHGLGVAPKIIIYKRTDGSGPWYWVYKYVDDTLDYLILSGTNAKADLTLGTYGFSTSTTFTNLGFGNTHQLIAYCFAEKAGYSKFGSYTGNGNADGPFVYTGFKPAFVMIKRTDSTGSWYMLDNKRNTFNVVTKYLKANETTADSTIDFLDFTSNGFKMISTGADVNTNNASHIYMAFAEEPIVANIGTNGLPATAR